MKTVACIIARTNSTRLQKKVLKEIGETTLIEYIIAKIKRSKKCDEIYICTSFHEDDKILLEIAAKNKIKSYAGSLDSVIERMLAVAEIENADNVVRITADNIFTDELYLDLMINLHHNNNADYTRTEYLPIGVTAEVISVAALQKCFQLMNPNESQYLMLFMFQPSQFNCQVLIPPKEHQHTNWSLTVDNPHDWERTLAIIKNNVHPLNYFEILDICSKEKIPNLEFAPSGNVKLPANLQICYKAFRTEMDFRIEKSNKISIDIEMLKSLNHD